MAQARERTRLPSPARVAARSVLLLLLAVYTATFSGLPDNPDAEVSFQTTRSLARGGSLALGDATPEARRIAELRFDVLEGRGAGEGRLYGWFGLAQAAAAVPLYWAGAGLAAVFPEIERRHAESTRMGAGQSEYFAHLLVGWRNPLLGALTAWLLVRTLVRIGVGRTESWLAGLSYGLASYAWPQARSTLSDVQATFFLFWAYHLIVRLRSDFQSLRAPRRRHLAGFGAALGLAFLTRVATAPAVLVLALTAFFVLRAGRAGLTLAARHPGGPGRSLFGMLAWAAAPALAALGIFLWANQARFGSPFESGYGEATGSGTFFGFPPYLGLAGVLFSPGRGLVWLAPLVLLVPFGAMQAIHRGEWLWPWTAGVMTAAVLLPVAFLPGWHGGWTYGPRYLLPLLPYLWVGVGLAFDRASRRPLLRRWAIALAAAGVLVSLPGALVDHMTHQELALGAARQAWPDVDAPTERDADEARFQAIQWDFAFAAPWAHWRILRHRVAGLSETFSPEEIFFVRGGEPIVPEGERERGFRHLAWVDLAQRLGGPRWPGVAIVGALLLAGVVLAVRGLDPLAA